MPNVGTKIDNIKLYKFHIFPQNAKSGQEHIFCRICIGSCCGWGECRIPVAKNGAESFNTAKALDGLYGLSISEAKRYIEAQFGLWRYSVSEMAHFALIDLEAKMRGLSSLQLLGLNSVTPIMLARAVPSNDREGIMRRIEQLLLNDERITKIHLSGDTDYDMETVEIIRREYDRERLYLIGSASGAYASEDDLSVESLGVKLLKMYTAGLDAVEDPIDASFEKWSALQEFCSPFPLVIQSPLRPARQGMARINSSVAEIFCIRPGVHGSVYDAIALASKMKNAGRKIVIGDDGFIGPGCAQWQQIAIGLGAEWVEAIEKKNVSDVFLSSLVNTPLIHGEGFVSMTGGSAGFGLDIDERMLELDCTQVMEL